MLYRQMQEELQERVVKALEDQADGGRLSRMLFLAPDEGQVDERMKNVIFTALINDVTPSDMPFVAESYLPDIMHSVKADKVGIAGSAMMQVRSYGVPATEDDDEEDFAMTGAVYMDDIPPIPEGSVNIQTETMQIAMVLMIDRERVEINICPYSWENDALVIGEWKRAPIEWQCFGPLVESAQKVLR